MKRDSGEKGSYRDLLVWQKGLDLVDRVYDIVAQLPPDERYAMAPQLRRAVTSVVTNIAEGQGRATRRDFANFLTMARGSVFEVETLVTIAQRRHYIGEDAANGAFASTTEVSKMLHSLRKRIREGSKE